MKTIVLFLSLFLFAACMTGPDGKPAIDVAGIVKTATDAVVAADKNADGQLSNRETKDFGENPLTWLTILGGLLGGAGYMGSRKAQKDADELFDRVTAK